MQFLHIQNHPKLFDVQSSVSHPPGIQLFVYQTYSLYREREKEIERERMRKMFGWQWKLQRSEIKELLNRLLVVRHLTLSKIKNRMKKMFLSTLQVIVLTPLWTLQLFAALSTSSASCTIWPARTRVWLGAVGQCVSYNCGPRTVLIAFDTPFIIIEHIGTDRCSSLWHGWGSYYYLLPRL